MKFSIQVWSDSELLGYEAVALAMTLATFDHQVQVLFCQDSWRLLADTQSRVYGMVQSFELYDMPMAIGQFADAVWAEFDDKITACIQANNQPINQADNETCVLRF